MWLFYNFESPLLSCSLVCVAAADLGCAQTSTQDPSSPEHLSVSCLLGDMTTITAATCSLTYKVPSVALTATQNSITAAIAFDPFPVVNPTDPGLPAEGVAELDGNNRVATCVV